jgi:hypothetical protein
MKSVRVFSNTSSSFAAVTFRLVKDDAGLSKRWSGIFSFRLVIADLQKQELHYDNRA